MMKKIAPDPSLPVPRAGAYPHAVAGIALGMTESDVLALCSHRTSPTIQQQRPALDRGGHEVDPTFNPATVVGETYLGAMTCFSHDTGLTQIQFAAPPSQKVVQVDHSDYTVESGSGVPLAQYMSDLQSKYGQPAERVGPEAISDDRVAVTYKWLFTKTAFDLDCAPRVQAGSEERFGAALLEGMPCATQLTVRVAIQGTGAGTPSVFAADYKILNLREKVDAERAHLSEINRRFGTSFRDEAGDQLERLGRNLVCTEIVSGLMKGYMTSKRDEAIDAAVRRMVAPDYRELMSELIKKGDIGDQWFTDLSRQGAAATCEAIFAAYDESRTRKGAP